MTASPVSAGGSTSAFGGEPNILGPLVASQLRAKSRHPSAPRSGLGLGRTVGLARRCPERGSPGWVSLRGNVAGPHSFGSWRV